MARAREKAVTIDMGAAVAVTRCRSIRARGGIEFEWSFDWRLLNFLSSMDIVEFEGWRARVHGSEFGLISE